MTNSNEFQEETVEDQQGFPTQIDGSTKSGVGDVEIPRNEWVEFLDSFSLQHEEWLASLSVAHEPNAWIEKGNCPLQRIGIHCAMEKWCVNISMLQDGEQRIYLVPDPLHLTFKRDKSGAHQGLDISSANGSEAVRQGGDHIRQPYAFDHFFKFLSEAAGRATRRFKTIVPPNKTASRAS
jgi:hypothetical protein